MIWRNNLISHSLSSINSRTDNYELPSPKRNQLVSFPPRGKRKTKSHVGGNPFANKLKVTLLSLCLPFANNWLRLPKNSHFQGFKRTKKCFQAANSTPPPPSPAADSCLLNPLSSPIPHLLPLKQAFSPSLSACVLFCFANFASFNNCFPFFHSVNEN